MYGVLVEDCCFWANGSGQIQTNIHERPTKPLNLKKNPPMDGSQGKISGQCYPKVSADLGPSSFYFSSFATGLCLNVLTRFISFCLDAIKLQIKLQHGLHSLLPDPSMPLSTLAQASIQF
jgi:hypothetical protein